MLFNLIAAGVAAGFMAGIFGIGGGAIVIPVLMYLYQSGGMENNEAIRLAFGTSLATMAFTGMASFLSHCERGNVDFVWLKKLCIPAGLGATAGALVATRIPGVWLALGLALMLAYFGFKLLIQREHDGTVSVAFVRFRVAAGVLSGVAYSLAGMGGASVITFFLTHVGLPIRRAIGTATGVILPISLGAMIAPHDWRWGYIDLHALLVMSVCAVVASRFGVWAAAALPTLVLRRGFGLFMMGLAGKTIYTAVL
jgi:uncharacterized membrane protein YfcA